jgi:hypothetical protein
MRSIFVGEHRHARTGDRHFYSGTYLVDGVRGEVAYVVDLHCDGKSPVRWERATSFDPVSVHPEDALLGDIEARIDASDFADE